MFVAEMIDYPLGPTAGQIRLLEDRDGDGRYEHATVFAEGLRFPNGVLAARGGVFVTAAPDILFLKDTDGDGEADEKRVVFTGFGEGNQQLRANGLTWGLDNWIYGANGRSDGNVRAPGRSAGKGRFDSRPRFSLSPRRQRIRSHQRRKPIRPGERRLGQSLPVVEHDPHSPRAVRSGVSWIAIRRLSTLRRARHRRSVRHRARCFPSAPGRRPSIASGPTITTRCAGLTIYRGDALGADYVGQRVRRRVADESRASPRADARGSRRSSRAAASTIASFWRRRDPWFHPVYMTTGPDGALYIVDFYRRWVEHPAFVAERLRDGRRLAAGYRPRPNLEGQPPREHLAAAPGAADEPRVDERPGGRTRNRPTAGGATRRSDCWSSAAIRRRPRVCEP